MDDAELIDALTVHWEEDGVLKVEELGRKVLHHGGGWVTIAFLARDIDAEHDDDKGPRVVLRRYRKRGGRYELQAKFNLSSAEQAHALVDALTAWFGPSD